MIDILANSKSALLAARGIALGAMKTPNGRNAMLLGGVNLGIQYRRSRMEERPFGLYGAAKSFGLGAMGGYYGGIALRVGRRNNWQGGPSRFMLGMQREFEGYGTRASQRNISVLRNIHRMFV